MYRVFGVPFTVGLHQYVTFLRLKQVPFKVYCTNMTTTLLYSFYYGAKCAFSVLTPSGTTCLQLWDLAAAAELDEKNKPMRGIEGEVLYVQPKKEPGKSSLLAGEGTELIHPQRMLIDKKTHPQLHVVCWATIVFSCWWLGRTGALYRYIYCDSTEVIEGFLRFFVTFPSFVPLRGLAPIFRSMMEKIITMNGVSQFNGEFYQQHFQRMCAALDEHFRQHPEMTFLLGTPHPTLADVTLGSAFSNFFLAGDPPATMIAEKYPHLLKYVERITGWKGGQYTTTTTTTTEQGTAETPSTHPKSTDEYPDEVPESLFDFLSVMAEVFPFLLSQCASFHAYMSSDAVRTIKKGKLDGKWEGCEAYLFPQQTGISSLLIIDRSPYTIFSRSQDLEVAFLAAREVFDDDLEAFGRLKGDVPAAHEKKGVTAGVPAAHTGGEATIKQTESNKSAEEEPAPTTAAPETNPDSIVYTKENSDKPNWLEGEEKEDGESLGHLEGRVFDASVWLDRNAIIPDKEPVIEADNADFYRAYTDAGLRHCTSVALRRRSSLIAHQKSSAVAVGGETSLVARPPVRERVKLLKNLMSEMVCAQYTLTTVYVNRRIYVAAIPEYQVQKVRTREAKQRGEEK